MKVVLKNNWFAPNGTMFLKSVPGDKRGAHVMPDAWEKLLPSTALVVGKHEIQPEVVRRLINERPGPIFQDPEAARLHDLALAQAKANETQREEEAKAAAENKAREDTELVARIKAGQGEGSPRSQGAGSRAQVAAPAQGRPRRPDREGAR